MITKNASKRVLVVFGMAVLVMGAAFFVKPARSPAAADPLLGSVPSGFDMVLSVDMERIAAFPLLRDAMENTDDPEWEEMKNKLNAYGIEWQDLCKRFVLFSDSRMEEKDDDAIRFGLLVHTGIEEDVFRKIVEEQSAESEVDYQTRRLGDREVHLLSEYNEVMPDSPFKLPMAIAATYLDPSLVLFTSSIHLDGMVGQIETGETLAAAPPARMADVEGDALLWAIYDAADDARFETEPLNNIAGAALFINLTGPDRQDVRLQLTIESDTEENAKEMHAQFSAFAGMIPMFFQDDMELGMKVAEAFDIDLSAPNEVQFRVLLDQELTAILHEKARESQ